MPGTAEAVGKGWGIGKGGRAGGSGKLPGEAGRWSRTEGHAWTASYAVQSPRYADPPVARELGQPKAPETPSALSTVTQLSRGRAGI